VNISSLCNNLMGDTGTHKSLTSVIFKVLAVELVKIQVSWDLMVCLQANSD
jgi:hypothetical protein